MNRIIALIICVIMVVSVCCVLPLSASAADTLTVSDGKGHSVTVAVGQDVLYTVCFYSGKTDTAKKYQIINSEGYIQFTPDKLAVDLYGEFDFEDDELDITYNRYSFPLIGTYGLVSNPFPENEPGMFYFNHSNPKTGPLFNNPDCILAKVRFKATAPGTAEIGTMIKIAQNNNSDIVINNNVPNADYNGYTVSSLEAAQYIIGDVDGDWDVTIKDAALLQKICSGSSDAYELTHADTDLDNRVTLKDVLGIRKYLVGNTPSVVGTPNFNPGVSVFASEQA